jgi:CheY-like chemotaxis protein
MNISTPDILLVEDSQSDVDLFMLAHQRIKSAATIGVAHDGVEAVTFLIGDESRAADAQDALPRLVLLALNMPRLNGFEVLKRLRADTAYTGRSIVDGPTAAMADVRPNTVQREGLLSERSSRSNDRMTAMANGGKWPVASARHHA